MKVNIIIAAALIFVIVYGQIEVIQDDLSKIILTCRWNKATKKCQDPTKTCPLKKGCCKPTGKFLADGTPACNCYSILLSGPCDNCVWSGVGDICKDPSLKCTGTQCCNPKYFPLSKEFTCVCNSCPPVDTCSWNKATKKCQDPNKICVGEKCCQPTGKFLTDGTPGCACSGSALLGQCDQCVWTGIKQDCRDPIGKCVGDLCCNSVHFLNSPEFTCKCNKCPQVDTCTWNKEFKKCQDPNKICVGEKCCQPTGKFFTDGTPQCACSGSVANGQCDECLWTGYLDTCKDPFGKCTGDLCCQPQYFPLTKQFTCKCNQCPVPTDTCRWNKELKKCQDPNQICVGQKCCQPTGKLFDDGTPQCSCTGSLANGQCDDCLWTGYLDECKDPTGKCTGDLCCQPQYFPLTKEFSCKCNQCTPPPTDTCQWNKQIKQCQDPMKICVGQKCCQPTGKILTTGVPECSCSGSAADGQCDECVWFPTLDGTTICRDPTGKCSGDICCQPRYFQNKDFTCKCDKCGCQWNNLIQRCEDLSGTCTGKNCCYPSKLPDVNGNPVCFCASCF